MQVEDPLYTGGAEERRVRRIHEARGAGGKAQGEEEWYRVIFVVFYPWALSLMP
jgi:hypothetical protein